MDPVVDEAGVTMVTVGDRRWECKDAFFSLSNFKYIQDFS